VIFLIAILQFQVAIPTNCRPLTCMNIIYVLGHEGANSLSFRCIASILWILTVFWCGYVKSSILYNGDGLQFNICACYWWQMALEFGLGVSFDNIYKWKGIREKSGEVNSTKAYITSDETSCRILAGCYANAELIKWPVYTREVIVKLHSKWLRRSRASHDFIRLMEVSN
jgi:hypothetical protein